MAANRDLEGASLLSFGVVIGGRSPQNELVGEALRPIAQRVVELRKGYPQKGLMINVIFHVPGPIHQPDYEGVHARRLDRKSGELLVHAAVPPTLRFDGVPNYVAEVLSQVRQEARDYLKERRINLSTAAVDSLIGTVIEELRSQ